MSEKRIGTLIYDPSMGRYDIRFGIESYYGGLHCGECFDVKVNDAWIPVRIEMDEDWYLVGLPKTRLLNLTAYRMAGIQCGMGQIFKSVQSGTGCDHDRCDHYADRKEAFDKRYRKYCGWFRTFICRDFIHVLSGGTTER